MKALQRTRRRRLVGATGILTSLVLVAACGAGGRDDDDDGDGNGGGSAVGVTDDSIKVGGTFPLTGVAAPGYSEIPQAIDAYFKHVNANGGVNGRRLKMIARDDGYNPTNTVKVTKQICRRIAHGDGSRCIREDTGDRRQICFGIDNGKRTHRMDSRLLRQVMAFDQSL